MATSQPLLPLPTAPRAAIYLRVSTDDQAASGLGLEAQEARCRALATARAWDVVAVFSDEGVSGSIDPRDRPQFKEFLYAVATRQVDVLIVLKLDRVGRRAEWIHRTLRELDEVNVGFVAVADPVDTSTAMGKAVIGITAVFAELERNLAVERTKAALAAKKARGERIGGAYLGIRVLQDPARPDKTIEEVVPEEQGTVERILALRRQRLPLRHIAAVLASEGRRTKRGGNWHPNTIARVLTRSEGKHPLYSA